MPITRTRIVRATGYDPWANLAAEEFLLQRLSASEATLYLWQNQHTVVVGRHQNAWRECQVEKLQAEGGKLARRLSGGGAVYHDLGNLNFTFILPKEDYDLQRQLKVILNAARAVGVQAEFSGRNDILAAGRKFSGNAFYHGKHASYHHGTILVDVDMGKLSTYLNVPAAKMTAKGVSSVQSRVINLRELVPTLTIEAMKAALSHAFTEEYGASIEQHSLDEFMGRAEYNALYEKYGSWEFRLGKSPQFDISYETRFPWGGIEIGLTVSGGVVGEAKVYSDAMEAWLIEPMAESLVGCTYSRAALAARLEALSGQYNSPLISDVALWLQSEA
jgi:lipoate-protein ligase A